MDAEDTKIGRMWDCSNSLSSSISEQLHSAEDRLLLAIEAHDTEQIDKAVHYLYRQMEQAFEDSDLRRSYLASLLLELRWQTTEWDVRGNALIRHS